MESQDRSRPYRWALVVGMLGLGIAAGAMVPMDDAHASPPPGPPGQAPREPPPFAFEACSGKTEGDDCTVNFHDKSIEGSCLAYSDARLYCMPHDMPPPPDHAPNGDD